MKIAKLLCCLSIIVMMGCKKEKPGADTDPEKPSIPHDRQSVMVSFPDGAPVNYTDYRLFSLADEARPDASGNASVAYNKKHTNIAWLFDKSNNLVMAGFVNDTLKTIDAASTAKVMLYYAYAVPMLPEEVQQEFVNRIGSIKGVPGWINTFTDFMKADRQVLSKGTYLSALKAAVGGMGNSTANQPVAGNTEKLMGTGMEAVRQADISVSPGQQKSGLLISSEELSKIKITNHYRRRAHTFFYKTRFKDLGGVRKDILSEINETTASDRDEKVDPVGAVSSFTGVLGAWIEGKSMDFAAVDGGPFDFPLQDNESEATYKARVVGPGRWIPGKKLTSAEKMKMSQLEIETVAMDFLIPAFASLVSSKLGAKPGETATAAERESFETMVGALRTVVEEMVKGIPGVYDDMQKGNYSGATNKVFEALYAGNLGVAKDGFVKVMAILARNAVDRGFYVSPQYDEVASQEWMMKALEWTDLLLQGSDYLRIAYDISRSEFLEEWDLQLMGGKVTLVFEKGSDSLLQIADETRIRAEIRNVDETGGDQHPYFEWSTTGKYGQLKDTKGHSGTDFATADATVLYQSTANSSGLGDGDNIDYIYVKASFNNLLIGMDTIAVNVKKSNYEMKPTDGVVTGKKHNDAAHNVTLHLAKVVTGARDIPNHESLDFKVEWATDGVYGELVGNTTTYNDDDIVYKATSDQSGIFTETIRATVYAKNKGETDYFLYSHAKTTVEINNDPKKVIMQVSLYGIHRDSTYVVEVFGRKPYEMRICSRVLLAAVPKIDDAAHYFVRFMGTPFGHEDGTTAKWNAGSPSPHPPLQWWNPREDSKAYYLVVQGLGSKNGPSSLFDHSAETPASGVAEITVTLK